MIHPRRNILFTPHVLLGRSVLLCIFLLSAGTWGHAQTTGIVLVQHRSKDVGSTTGSSLAFVGPNTAGNWIAVCVRAGYSNRQVFTVKDSRGNTYRRAWQLGITSHPFTLAIYYSENIKGGANTITVSDTVLGLLRFAIFEYSGVAKSKSLDVTAMAQGISAAPNSRNVTTTASGDLLLGAIVTANPAFFTAGGGYKIEERVAAEPNSKLLAEDRMQGTRGAATASATLAVADNWGAALAAFKSAGVGVTKPSITSQPVNQTVTAGQTATFTAVAMGTAPLSYQWQKSGVNIAGATSSSYRAPATTTTESGSTFRVVVRNSAGTASSNAASLTVNAATLLLNVSSTSLAFGNVLVSGTSTQRVMLTNSGNSKVTISNVIVSGAGFNASGDSAGLILSPGQTATLTRLLRNSVDRPKINEKMPS